MGETLTHAAAPAGPAIRARGLGKRFGDLQAVDKLDLDISRSQIYGFLGPNGSGKSTTIRMLCGLLLPTSGSALVLGHRVPEDAEAVRKVVERISSAVALT